MRSSAETEESMKNLLFDRPFLYKKSFELLYIYFYQFIKLINRQTISPLINLKQTIPQIYQPYIKSIILLLAFLPRRVQVNDHKSKSRNDSRPDAEEVWVGHEQESLELVVLVWSDGHSLGQSDEVVAWFFVDDFELVDTFLLRGLRIKYKSTQNSALYSPFLASVKVNGTRTHGSSMTSSTWRSFDSYGFHDWVLWSSSSIWASKYNFSPTLKSVYLPWAPSPKYFM